jgi:tRNA (guanine-N7-)-methyltransferase
VSSRPRTRQHVNPLSYRGEVVVPDWATAFARPDQPREVDVGSAHGDFLLARAAQRPDLNLIGLEIRRPMVERLQKKLDAAALDNAVIVTCNANTSFRALFPTPASLRAVYVHFPDPWFKKRHHKRRIMTPAFVDDVAACLEPGGLLRFVTDHLPYADEVEEQLRGREDLRPADDPVDLPLTHREEWHRGRGDPVRALAWSRT